MIKRQFFTCVKGKNNIQWTLIFSLSQSDQENLTKLFFIYKNFYVNFLKKHSKCFHLLRLFYPRLSLWQKYSLHYQKIQMFKARHVQPITIWFSLHSPKHTILIFVSIPKHFFHRMISKMFQLQKFYIVTLDINKKFSYQFPNDLVQWIIKSSK